MILSGSGEVEVCVTEFNHRHAREQTLHVICVSPAAVSRRHQVKAQMYLTGQGLISK